MTRLASLLVVVTACAANGAAPSGEPSGLASDGDGKADGVGGVGGLKTGKLSWACHDKDATGNTDPDLEIVHDGKTIISETIGGYHVIENSQPATDLGATVFNVKPSAITFLDTQELKFSLSLQDYSDMDSWLVYLQADPGQPGSYFGVMLSTFESSDGDELLHPSSIALACTVTKG